MSMNLKSTIPVINKLGLHARAAAKLVSLAQQFNSEIILQRMGREANAKSMMGILMLGSSMGTTLEISVNGDDATAALEAIETIFKLKFDEPE